MQDTCRETCPYWKKFYSRKHGQQCPNYIETTWQSENENRTQIVKDCAPKRSVLMQMDLYNRLIGAQKASEQARNESKRVSDSLLGLCSMLKTTKGDTLKVEDKDGIPELLDCEL